MTVFLSYPALTLQVRTPATAGTVRGHGRLVGVDMEDRTCWTDTPNRYHACEDAVRRFWVMVDKTDGCWNWTRRLVGSPGYRHYGAFKSHRGFPNALAHRYSYTLLVGPIPEGLTLDHLCMNPRCVNPAHLEPVTMAENLRRGTSPSALNALKTACPQGHPYAEKRTSGQRTCLTCRAAQRRESRRRARLLVTDAGRIDDRTITVRITER